MVADPQGAISKTTPNCDDFNVHIVIAGIVADLLQTPES